MTVELVLDAKASTGECPTWAEREGILYWVDVEEPALHRLDPQTGEDQAWGMPSQIASFVLCRSGRVLAALRTGLVMLDWPSRTAREIVASPPYDPRTHRFNDGKCDMQGRFWVGIMHKPLPGEEAGGGGPDRADLALPLHVFDTAEGLRPADARAAIGNGLAWGPDHRSLYFADSEMRVIRRFDFDPVAARISNPRVLARFAPEEGVPDGATVDAEGCYWCALYGGSRLVRLDPDGHVDREIALPVSQPTMCTFGGSDLGTLYITSASNGLGPEAREREPLAGGIFRCRPGMRGLPPALFADTKTA